MISILTPVHPASSKWIGETYESLAQQTFVDWEWVVLVNGGLAGVEIPADTRVRVVDGPVDGPGVGALKRLAASYARGDVLVELDADDLLVPHALERVAEAFADPSVGFVYSNAAAFYDADRSPVEAYSAAYGWQRRDFAWGGQTLNEMVAWPASPHMLRNIWWAPDHVRAWRTGVYVGLGGHDAGLVVGDDHDLCCRTYLALGSRGIRHIDECLYVYRVHGQNTHLTLNGEVQEQSLRNYLRYSRDMAVRWARDEGLSLLDLGGRFGRWDGFTTVDLLDADVTTNLNGRWPFADNSVGVIKAHHIFEHLKDPVWTMNEAFRVLAPGGWLFVEVPSTDGRGAWQDPTHVSFWNENSIRYYTTEQHGQYIRPAWRGRFQNARTVTYDPFGDPTVPVVQADLIALKGTYAERPVGEVR
jgi:glycosyltransferase involved in cell wall biosynthesis